MLYDGKKASLQIQMELQEKIAELKRAPVLAVFAIPTHPSITSFIAIKKRFAQAIGVTLNEYTFDVGTSEDVFVNEIKKCIESKKLDGLIVQLPLPKSYNTKKILDMIPEVLDVDVLSKKSFETFKQHGTCIPPVAGAVAYILQDTHTSIQNKKIVVIGNGKLVGEPVSIWLQQQGVTPISVTIDTEEDARKNIYKEADIVISGIGRPHHLKKEFFKQDVVLIDAGTSEQAGVLAGDFDPSCNDIASIITPVPGGVGPLTVVYLFKNLLEKNTT